MKRWDCRSVWNFSKMKLKYWLKNINVLFVRVWGNKKLESLKSFCLKVNKHTRQLPLALDSIKPYVEKLICKATTNMNNIQPQKYSYPPKAIKENAIRSKKFWDIYDFYGLLKVQKHAERYANTDVKKGKLLPRRLREPLKVGERVLVMAERLKKKEAPKHFYKSTTQKVSLFNREQIFVVRKVINTSKNNYLYWISKEYDDKIIDKCFLRQELFALNDQFRWWNQLLFIITI